MATRRRFSDALLVEIAPRPYDFLRCVYLNDVWIVRPSVAIHDLRVSVRQALYLRDPSQHDTRQVVLEDRPNNFLRWGNL